MSPTIWPTAASDHVPARCLRPGGKHSGKPDDGSDVDRADEPADADAPEAVVRCAACGHELTRLAERIAVDGRHEHVFTNPHGIVFHVLCFRNVPGCASIGEASEEWTWFSGYAWRVAVCRSCTTHVGWSYAGGDSGFFGLIAPRVVVGPETE